MNSPERRRRRKFREARFRSCVIGSAAVIRYAVWLYLRCSLSFRDIETVRDWTIKFAPLILRQLRRRRSTLSPHRRRDVMIRSISGKRSGTSLLLCNAQAKEISPRFCERPPAATRTQRQIHERGSSLFKFTRDVLIEREVYLTLQNVICDRPTTRSTGCNAVRNHIPVTRSTSMRQCVSNFRDYWIDRGKSAFISAGRKARYVGQSSVPNVNLMDIKL